MSTSQIALTRDFTTMDSDTIDLVDRCGRRQHGLITRDQATEALGAHRMYRWISDGRLTWAQPRVLRIAGAPRTPQQEMVAASLAADGPVSHRAASWTWGLLDDGADLADVSIRYPRQVALRPPAVVHRIRDLRPHHELSRAGMRITTPMRTIVDLGLVEPWWVVDGVLGRAISSRLLPIQAVMDLRADLARRGRNGTGVVQRVFDERLLRGADEDSGLEPRLLRIIRRFGLPAVSFQHEVWSEGRFVARVDAAYPERRVAIEADGFVAHSDPESFQRDRERQNALVLLGWTILRFTRHDIVRRPANVADQINSVL